MPTFQRVIDLLHRWAASGQAGPVAGLWTFLQSAALPIPSDALLVALGLAEPRRAPILALWSAAGAIVGATVAYLIGALAFHTIGLPIITWFEGGAAQIKAAEQMFEANGWLIVALGSLPFVSSKLISILAGAFGFSFPLFLTVFTLTRGIRFIAIGVIIRLAGPRVQQWFQRHQNQKNR